MSDCVECAQRQRVILGLVRQNARLRDANPVLRALIQPEGVPVDKMPIVDLTLGDVKRAVKALPAGPEGGAGGDRL